MEVCAEISEPAILLKPARLYRPGMSDTELYDITRGVWRVDRHRAEHAALALAVVGGEIVEVYSISGWHPANTTSYRSRRVDQSDARYAGRFEFTGQIASSTTRRRYLGLSVNHLFGRGQVIRYLNC